jgi:phosphonate transport system substrate-binding protein
MKQIVVVLVSLVFLMGTRAIGQNMPKELRFGWPYEKGDIEGICQNISQQLGVPVVIVPLKDYKSTKSKFVNDSVDFCYLSGFAYILAEKDAEFQPELLACIGDANGNPVTYQSLLIASKASGISNAQQLKDKAADLEIAFVTASSTSGHLFPRIFLNSLGIDQAEAQFKNIQFAGSHEAAIQALASGKVQLAVCSPHEYAKAVAKGIISDDKINVIWKSDPIPQGPMVASKKLDAAVKAKLTQAFIQIAKTSPEVYNAYQKKSSMARNSAQFIAGKEEYFSSLKQMTSSMEEFLQMLMNFYLE